MWGWGPYFSWSYSVKSGDSDLIEKNISGIENLEVGAITS